MTCFTVTVLLSSVKKEKQVRHVRPVSGTWVCWPLPLIISQIFPFGGGVWALKSYLSCSLMDAKVSLNCSCRGDRDTKLHSRPLCVDHTHPHMPFSTSIPSCLSHSVDPVDPGQVGSGCWMFAAFWRSWPKWEIFHSSFSGNSWGKKDLLYVTHHFLLFPHFFFFF